MHVELAPFASIHSVILGALSTAQGATFEVGPELELQLVLMQLGIEPSGVLGTYLVKLNIAGMTDKP